MQPSRLRKQQPERVRPGRRRSPVRLRNRTSLTQPTSRPKKKARMRRPFIMGGTALEPVTPQLVETAPSFTDARGHFRFFAFLQGLHAREASRVHPACTLSRVLAVARGSTVGA